MALHLHGKNYLMKTYKWYFRIVNDWDFIFNGSIPIINIEFLSFHWEFHTRWFTIIGFSFVWERLAYQRNKK